MTWRVGALDGTMSTVSSTRFSSKNYIISSLANFFSGLFSSKDSIMVPMKKRVPFRINGKIVQLSLYELLYHNGIVVKDDKRMKELKGE